MNNPIDVSAMFALAPGLAPATAPGAVPSANAAAPGALAPTPQPNVRRVEGATPGCYALYISDEDYHTRYPGLSSTQLKQLVRSPGHYKAYLEKKDEDSAARQFGRAVHALLLEPYTFNDKFTVWTDGVRRGKKYDEFAIQHAGKTILTEDQHTRALEAALALRNCPDLPELGDYIDAAVASPQPLVLTEFSIFWDEVVGEGDDAGIVKCKARIDLHLTPSVRADAFDVKTTDDVREDRYNAQFSKMDYGLQAVHYCAALKAFYGQAYQFWHAAVESEAPFASRIFKLDGDVFEHAAKVRAGAMARLLTAQRTNVWPNREPGAGLVQLSFRDRFRSRD